MNMVIPNLIFTCKTTHRSQQKERSNCFTNVVQSLTLNAGSASSSPGLSEISITHCMQRSNSKQLLLRLFSSTQILKHINSWKNTQKRGEREKITSGTPFTLFPIYLADDRVSFVYQVRRESHETGESSLLVEKSEEGNHTTTESSRL